MNQPSPTPAPSRLRYYVVGVVALAVILAAIGVRSRAPQAAAERARAALRPGISIQEGLLAIAAEDRRFSLVVVAEPESLGRSSTLHFEGDAVRVVARDRFSKSGGVTLHEALAQLSGELASVEGQPLGWRGVLDFGGELRTEVRLSPRGEILP